MSKTKGNIIKPREMLDSVGVDAVRMQFCTSDPGNSKRFSEDMIRESVRPFLNILWNTNSYFSQLKDATLVEQPEDRWIVSRLNSTIKNVVSDLDNYYVDKAMLRIFDFTVNDLSRTYIRLTRDRDDNKDVVAEILEKVAKMIAPYAPHIAEVIYQNFNKGKSIHFDSYPKVDESKIIPSLEEEFVSLMEIIESGLKFRDKNQVGLKWPLAKAIIGIKGKLSEELHALILSQLNVKNVEFVGAEETSVELDLVLTPELEAEGFAREISRKVQAGRKTTGLVKEDKIKLFIDADFNEGLKKNESFIADRVGATEIVFGPAEGTFDYSEEDKIKDKAFKLAFLKY